MKIEVFRNVGI